jgi:4-amino-4-deoxy-L-arabinose transferase and related glycosyltransferases of PMT family
MFATIPATFALSSIALFDMVFATFLFGAVGCLLIACRERRPRVEWCGYALLTLAVMTKGPVALGLVGLFLVTALLVSKGARAQVQTLRWKTGLFAVAVAASPWFLWMNWRFGSEFITAYLLAGNLWYFTQPAQFSAHAISHTFYARAFAGAFFPWSVIVMGRGIDALRSMRSGESAGARRNAALAVGPRGDWVFQPRAVQAGPLHLSRCPGMLHPRGARVARRCGRHRRMVVGHEVQRPRHRRSPDSGRELRQRLSVQD